MPISCGMTKICRQVTCEEAHDKVRRRRAQSPIRGIDAPWPGHRRSAGVHPPATGVCFTAAVITSKWALRGAGLAVAALALTGCALNDEIYVSSFTDAHGRACTFVYTAREGAAFTDDGRDVDVSQLDCEYPPPGQAPGPPTTTHLDPRPTGR